MKTWGNIFRRQGNEIETKPYSGVWHTLIKDVRTLLPQTVLDYLNGEQGWTATEKLRLVSVLFESPWKQTIRLRGYTVEIRASSDAWQTLEEDVRDLRANFQAILDHLEGDSLTTDQKLGLIRILSEAKP